MYERYTGRAGKTMQLANQPAQQLGHESILPEHVLIGLVTSGSNFAVMVLQNLGFHPQAIATEVEQRVGSEQQNTEMVDQLLHCDSRNRLPHSDETKRLVDVAVAEARQLHHNHVGTEHILLALLRKEDGIASQVLVDLGVTYAGVRLEVLNVVGQNPPHRLARTEKQKRRKNAAVQRNAEKESPKP